MQIVLALFPWLITAGSEIYFSEVKVDESYRWRHQLSLQKGYSELEKTYFLKIGWFLEKTVDEFCFILHIPREYRLPILQNPIGRSGKSPWVKIRPNIFSRDTIAENFRFFALSITHWNISCVPSSFLHFRVTWLS